jgi:hypothetical protein
MEWASSCPISLPTRSDARPKKVRIARGDLQLPDTLSTNYIRAAPSSRNPGGTAVSIEVALITAERTAFRALSLAVLGYALSDQKRELRIAFAGKERELAQLVLWPSDAAAVERILECRQRISEIEYRPRLPTNNPNYTTTEQDDERYPREHLPYCRLGSLNVGSGVGICRPGEPVAAHFNGTALSLIWLGKYLANLALEDNNATLAYLYNLDTESMTWNSAELRLTVCSPADGPKLFPPAKM